jgi:hypothetical protein
MIELPIYLPNNLEVEGIDLTIQYDPEVFELIGYNNENSSLDKSVYSTIINEKTPGIFKLISYAAAKPIDYKGLLGSLKFQMISNTTTHSTIWIDEMKVNAISEGGFLIEDGVDEGNISRGFEFNIRSLPEVFNLKQNYPNPFNPSTNIRFELPNEGEVQISIYDIRGSLVTELVSDWMEAGYHQLQWNGSHTASGIYFIQMIADNGSYHKTMKISLIK